MISFYLITSDFFLTEIREGISKGSQWQGQAMASNQEEELLADYT
jgi:hypothetical protein